MNTLYPDNNNTIFDLAAKFINETSEHVFLTGKAGTGKTTFLRHIRQRTHKRAVVAAPTGVAAINAGGVTLHSLFQLPFEPFIPGFSTNKNLFRFGKAKLDLLQQLELLIIDEVSMLRVDTLDAIDSILRQIRHSSKPFGGVQVLYIGDMFQLPPVAKADEWELLEVHYKSTFFFHSHVAQKAPPVYLELKTVYRQSEQQFIDLLNNVRNNCLSADDLKLLNARFQPDFSPLADEKYITLTTHNYKADQLNDRELGKLQGNEYIFAGEVKGEFPEYALPTDLRLRLKKEAQIMFIKNDPAGNYFNGKIAAVSRITDDAIFVYMPEIDKEIQVQKEVWKNVKYTLNKESGEVEEEELGAYSQYPLRLAWAVTIHKSQGLTFEKAIIDIGASFAAGQAYVALSRCTSLDGIVLRSKILPHCILTDEHAINFSKTEKEETELQKLLADGKRKFWTERLLLYFDWKPMHQILWDFDKLLADKTTADFDSARSLLSVFKQKNREWEEVAGKFRQQLDLLSAQEKYTHDIAPLRERCQKAVIYFHEQVCNDMLVPLQTFIDQFKFPKRAKTFRKNMVALESDIRLFLENMKRVRYNDIPLAEDLLLLTPIREDVFSAATEAKANTSPDSGAKKQSKEKVSRLPKGASAEMSLQLFNEGHSMEEIAALRNLAVSTIESHLMSFVGTEFSIDRFFDSNEIAELLPMLQPLLTIENPALKPVFEQLDEKYSYGKLRMLLHYFRQIAEK